VSDRRRLVACANLAAQSLVVPVEELSPDDYDEFLEYIVALVGELWMRRVTGAAVARKDDPAS
jgi:hypothetical protein